MRRQLWAFLSLGTAALSLTAFQESKLLWMHKRPFLLFLSSGAVSNNVAAVKSQTWTTQPSLHTGPLRHLLPSVKTILGNTVPFPEEGMQPNRDFLPPYVQPITVSVPCRAPPPRHIESLPLARAVSVTREGFRRHVASWHTNSSSAQFKEKKYDFYKIVAALQPTELLQYHARMNRHSPWQCGCVYVCKASR